ncbi:MAG: hypothetical protein HYV52_01655 [Parcubacteria group bacterium]|nr:hypothetical protein [Parcubacteria group bacterium]
MDNNKSTNNLTERVRDVLKKEYIVVGKTRVTGWYAWLSFGLIAGVVAGVIFVANRSGKFELVKAELISSTTTVNVNASKILGDLPLIYRTGIWIASAENSSQEYIRNKTFEENAIGVIQLNVDHEIAYSKNLSDIKKRLNKFIPVSLTEKIKDSKKILIVTIPNYLLMPNWLSARPNDERTLGQNLGSFIWQVSPPKCYEWECPIENENLPGWEQVVYETMKFFKERGITNIALAVGHEPNRDWLTKEENWYKLYAHSLNGAKKIYPSILIGGVGSWGWEEPKLKCDSGQYALYVQQMCFDESGWADPNGKSLTENFIAYIAKNNLPLDFINYHSFGTMPFQFISHGAGIRALLQEYGETYNRDFSQVKIYPADWTVWGGTYPADYLDTEYNSSYFINSLYYMNNASIQWHSYDFDVFDPGFEKSVKEQRGKNAQFIGDWPVFTFNQIIKPVYNAFFALSIFAGEKEQQIPNEIETTITDDGFVISVASQTKNKKTTRVLLSSFAPSADAVGTSKAYGPYLLSTLKSCMNSKGYSEEKLKLLISSVKVAAKINPPNGNMTLEYIKSLIANTAPDPKTREDLFWCAEHDVFEMKQSIDRYAKEPSEIKLSVSGLAYGFYEIKKYLIDANHSNGCGYNKKTEPRRTDTPCGIDGEIDQRVARAKQEAKRKGTKEAFSYLREQGYSENDLALGKKIAQSCKRKMACVQEKLKQRYQELDRCKMLQCSSADTTISELKTAIDIYKGAYARVFFYDSPDSIDKVNNIKEARLDTTEQKLISISAVSNAYREIIKLTPHSVLLVEIQNIEKLIIK